MAPARPCVEVHGLKMYLNPDDRVISEELRLRREWEPFETEVVMTEVRPGQVVVDVGANIGYYTLLFSTRVGPAGRVFAFEPAPESAALLHRNVAINGCDNVTVVDKAVSNTTGSLRLFLAEENKGDHRIYDSRDGRRSVAIESTRLDDYFAGYAGRIDWIKMDVQGAEAAAIDGMLGLLTRNRDIRLITEFWPYGLERAGVEAEEFLARLSSLGFLIYTMDEDEESIEAADTGRLLREYPSESGRFTNLLCTREPYVPAVSSRTTWRARVREAVRDIAAMVPPGDLFILVDNDEWGTGDRVAGRRRLPFPERDGVYWGAPADADGALRELERLQRAGAGFIVFGWPAFWWLDHYAALGHHLRSSFPCVAANDRVVVFDLRRPGDAASRPA